MLAKKAAVENNELKGRRESLLVFDCIKSSKTTKKREIERRRAAREISV